MEVTLEPVEVVSVAAKTGVKSDPAAFEALREILSNGRERTFYGMMYDGVYHACATVLNDAEPSELKRIQIPGGLFLRGKLQNWKTQPELIGQAFKQLSAGHLVDHSRPCVELYKSDDELVLLLPIRKPLL